MRATFAEPQHSDIIIDGNCRSASRSVDTLVESATKALGQRGDERSCAHFG
jgi:hypothetical protein